MSSPAPSPPTRTNPHALRAGTPRRAHPPAKPAKSRRELLNDIPDLVSSVQTSHLRDCERQARDTVRRAFARIDSELRADRAAFARAIAQREYDLSEPVRMRLRRALTREGIPFPRDGATIDPVNLSLAAVPQRLPSQVRARGGGMRQPPIRLRSVEPLPRYDSWIPVRTNFWVGKDLHLEPYMPFLGDQDGECEQAYEVFEDMADDAGKDQDLSDGEVNKDGKLVLPASESERVKFHTMSARRFRAATRAAILAVVDQFPAPDDTMWRILAQALGMTDLRRLKAVAAKAEERRREADARARRRKLERFVDDEVRRMPRTHSADEAMPGDGWNAHSVFLKHFCFTCHVFPCAQHTEHVEPVLPIEDLETKKRETLLKENRATPCSQECFLRPRRRRLPRGASEWAAEEILLLREAVPIFGLDPCSLAIVVGSRTCAEVSAQLGDPIEADIAADELEKARKPRRFEPKGGSQSGADDPRGKKGGVKASKATKTIVDGAESVSNDQDFSPCDHAGPCTAETCSCVKEGMYCETTCGCNFGRYGEGGACGGVVWLAPSEQAVRQGRARECLNRHYGCLCEAGHCADTSCPCWDQNRACSPDFCECDCTVLPGHAPLGKRMCRNTPLTIAHHKRTFVGKSDIHGFGLFAGERFEPGDLVGAYAGQLIDTRLADMIGRIYDATNRTYIFNVTETLVIDGGLLGSKAKFCNHTRPGDGENCASRLVRVRGDAYVALLCKRPVEAGEEFLFDYRFTGEVPVWAKEEKGIRKR